MRTGKKWLCLLLSVVMAATVLLPCAAAETYPESLFWDKAGEDADNGYKGYMVAFGAPLVVPEPPERSGSVFLGWKDWQTDEFVDLASETMNAEGRMFYAAWEAETVPFYFYVGSELLTTTNGMPGEPFVQPRHPELEGYTFSGWTPKTPAVTPDTSMSFTAVFTPNTYIATLLADGEVYAQIPYTYGQKSIDLPSVPKKAGYTGTWESYTLGIGGVTIRAIYTPDAIPFNFYVSGSLFATVNSIPGESFVQPRHPELDGYTFSGWTPKTPAVTPDTSMSFTAVFTPNTYIATLLADGEVYAQIPYTYGQKSIDLPSVPKKAGYTGTWESYTLGIGGVTIRAIYKASDTTVKTIAGDADGDSIITLQDAAVMQRTLAGGYDTEGVCGANMDVNGDGEMNLKDVVLVRRYLAGGWNVRLF